MVSRQFTALVFTKILVLNADLRRVAHAGTSHHEVWTSEMVDCRPDRAFDCWLGRARLLPP
jgi:hypothetical protein